MLMQLVESGHRREPIRRRLPALTFSLALHMGLLGGAVALTLRPPPPTPQPRPDSTIALLSPYDVPDRPPPDPSDVPVAVSDAPPTIDPRLLPPARIPDGIPPVDPAELAPFVPRSGLYRRPGDTGQWGPPGRDVGTGLIAVADVDEPPVLIRAPPVAYPPLLQRAGVEGVVLVEAVIDTAGRPEPASVRVVSSDHHAFDAVARDAILHARYRPGRVAGRPVRVLVRVPVAFEIRR